MSLAEREIPAEWVVAIVMIPFAVLVVAMLIAAANFTLNHVAFEPLVIALLIVIVLTKE